MSRPQVWSTVRWEAVIVALCGTMVGLGIGVFFGWAMVEALAGEGINSFCIPGGALGVVTFGGPSPASWPPSGLPGPSTSSRRSLDLRPTPS